MRLLILVAGSSLILTACGNKGQTDNTLNVDENMAAENIVSNDVTAIDAVTGDASNMAADVNYTEALNAATGTENEPAPSPRKRTPGKPPLETPTPDEPVTNNAT
jgi:hypothetical protein